jgi:hypothetical protein
VTDATIDARLLAIGYWLLAISYWLLWWTEGLAALSAPSLERRTEGFNRSSQ